MNTFANEGLTISSVNVTKQLFTANGDSEAVVIGATGDTFSQTASAMFSDVPVAGTVQSENSLTPGDYWILSYTMTLSDGRVMSIGSSTTITFQCFFFIKRKL